MPVVFDCDGVLVDSESLAWRAIATAMSSFGAEVSDDDRRALIGHPFDVEYAYFAERVELPAPEVVWEQIATDIHELIERHLQAFEDAVDVLEVLSARQVPVAVASSSDRQRLDLSLTKTNLGAFVDASVAGDEVTATKPAPDLFLRAAELLGVRPEDCTAVEDSPVGVAAAKAAGMRVIAVDRGEVEPGLLVDADLVVPRLTPALFLGS